MSTDAVPSIRSNNKGVAARGKDQAGSPTQSRLQMPRPRTSQPLPRKSLLPSQKRYDLFYSIILYLFKSCFSFTSLVLLFIFY